MRPLIWALKKVDPLGLRRQSGIHAQEIQEQLQFYAILGVTCTLRLQRRKIDTHHVTTCNIVKLRMHENNYKYIEFIDYNLMFIQKKQIDIIYRNNIYTYMYIVIVGKYTNYLYQLQKQVEKRALSELFCFLAASANGFYMFRQWTYIVCIMQCQKPPKKLTNNLKRVETRVVPCSLGRPHLYILLQFLKKSSRIPKG